MKLQKHPRVDCTLEWLDITGLHQIYCERRFRLSHVR